MTPQLQLTYCNLFWKPFPSGIGEPAPPGLREPFVTMRSSVGVVQELSATASILLSATLVIWISAIQSQALKTVDNV